MARKRKPIYKAPHKRKSKYGRYAMAVAAVLVAGWVAYDYLWAEPVVIVSDQYDASEVAHDRPIHAIHEMRPGPRIPFLPADQPQPRITVPKTVHDFGTIGPKAVVTHTFAIRNVGQGPLTISRAYTTCGCTTAEVTASVIPPGKVALVKLIFDAGFHDTAGQTVKRGLIIENNDRKLWKAEVWTRAKIRRS